MEALKKRFPSLSSLGSDGNTSFLRAARAGNLDKVLEHLKNNIDINTSNANGLNALHLASKDGHIHVVTELLKRGALVDSATKKGNTALHIASLAGQEEVVKLLLQHNASVNVQSQNGFTPLYMAAQENHDAVVKLLLSNGANQSLATEDGFTPLAVAMQQGHDKVVAVLLESDTRGKVRLPALHIAAKKDDVKAAALLLENDHNPDVTSKSGFTPLHIASHYGNEAIANLLIQKGADVNYAAKHNISPLHVAAKWGKTNMVSLLLEKGSNIEAKTRDGLTPLHCAARSGHEQVVDMLLERGAPISAKTKNGLAPLHMAAQGEHVDAARILLYHRAPVDEVTVDYLTALHVAAHCGHVRVAKLLLDRNADANARALNGFTPLHIACKKNRIKVVELLLRHGASISATTESGLTPLHVASFMGCMNIVIYLLQHDASPDVPTVRGETPLHLAARANQTDIIRILLRNGAQVDARAREQQTPLHIASRLGNVDIVMLLLQHGAQVDATTKDMYTALHIAAKEGQDEVAAVLIENGASLDATTKKGFTPLHLTAKYGHMKVAQLLLQKDAPVDAQGKNGVTPLHVASHYDNQNVALLLLEKGASPHATAKNGHTPLHIAARKNQMDIATTLLEYGAQADAESKAGFTPLHLSSQEGHADMSTLLLEHKASCDHQAKNGLTPLHLCAQEDKVNVAQTLVKNGANIEMTTKAGYTPLHVASHFGQANMVRFLLQNGSNVDAATGIGYTPLHQAAQQGHCHIVNLLLEHKANANAQTANGQTPLHIARKLGYISVLDSLKSITTDSATPTTTQPEEKYRVVAPEAMHETFMSDSEEEGGEDTVLSDQPYRYLTVDEMKSLGDDSLPIDVTRDERQDSNRMIQSTERPILEDHIIPQYAQVHKTVPDGKYISDNIMIDKHPQHVGFLVSFLVDARGGAMRGCRHSGVRIIVPTRSASQPTRITCRYVKPQRTMHPPQLMEGEALASRVLELGPVGTKFLGPVIMEVPHFASLRGKEREIVILRSDNGETWREHTIDNSEEIIHDVLNECFEPEDINQLDELGGGRICRFVTYDFPQYFAVVSRIRQEVHAIGPEGGMVSSTVVPQVQAVFPQGALTKKIKVGLQAQPIDPDLTAKLLGRGVAVSPIVTVEPRRRKFHKAITLSMPAPKAHSQGMINQYSGNAPTLRLLCSITGGPSRAQWEDVTGSTPLTFVNDCVSFTTTVSARFWLMDCRNISEATKMATELYREAIHVPFMAKFVVFAKRIEQNEARLRVFCMTDDKEDKTLEQQEHFTEVAKSRDVEVLEGKPQYIEMAGNLVPVTKSGDQLQLTFKAFRENRLPFNVRIKDQHADTVGRTLFMREPKVAKGEPPQQPICILNIVLPEKIIPDQITTPSDSREIISRLDMTYVGKSFDDYNYLGDMRIVDISNLLGEDWIRLAPEIGINQTEITNIQAQHPNSTARQAQSMIKVFKQQKADRNILENGLKTIGRDDIIQKCIKITSYIESSKQEHPVGRKRISVDDAYDEADIMKDSESVEELVFQDQRLQQMREREEIKYSAEEKIVEDSESDDEIHKRTVAERRQKIEKRLSLERAIPASEQKKEIVQELTEIKRKSLIEDKKAIHEEEIMLQMPTDNIIKSATVPDQIIKLKTNKIETPDISKSEFDKELQDKFKKSVKVQDNREEIHEEEQSKIVHDITSTEKEIQQISESEIKSESTETTKTTKVVEIVDIKAPEKLKEKEITSKKALPTPSPSKIGVTFKTPDDIKEEIQISPTAIITQFDKKDIIEAVSETVTDILDKSQKIVSNVITKKDDVKVSKIPIKKVKIDSKDILDPDLEKKLSMRKEKIEKSISSDDDKQIIKETITSAQKSTDKIKIEFKDETSTMILDDIVPKSYHEKQRESLTEEEFYKSVEASITKKMSEGLIQIDDNVLTSITKDIPESQTPPPTPIDAQSQKDGKYDSPGSIPEEIADAKKDDLYDEKYSPVHTKEDIELIREEAIILIDNILEESIMIINAQQCNNDYNSESEQYAITCDVNGIDMVKSPTIESLSGKSFDDNMSVNDELNVVPYNINTTTISTISYSSITSTPYIVNDIITTTTTTNTIMQATTSSVNDNNLVNNKLKNKQIENEITISTDTSKNNIKNSYKIDDENNDNNINEKLKYSQNNYDRIEKKFERLSSQLDENDITENVENFDNNFDNIINKDEISNLQSDFSKISWDESISGTTTAADIGLSTPDNDLQDLPTEPGSQTAPIETDLVPKPTPRLSITSVASDISHKQSEIISTEAKILEESKTESRVDEDVDFKQSKKFWESLESSQSDAQAPMPVPKPRSQIKSQLSEVQKADDSIGSAKSSSQSKISSEQQVEYSETSSVRTSFKEDDSELSDGKIELEEDVVQIQEKPEKEKQTEGENGGAAVGFYIGESSTNIITKSSTERRQEFAFDNEGYEGTFDEDRDIDELAYDEKQTDVEKSEVLVKTTAQESHEIAVASSKESFQSSAAKRQIEPEQKDETNIEESSRIQEYEIIELEDLERRKSETKVVRQPSETRNDILECEYDVGKPSEKEISKSMKDDETKEKKVDQPLKSEFVIHNMCYEDQTLPILQEAIKEDINMYTSEIIKNQVYQVKEQGFEEKSHIITKQAYGFDDIVGDQIHVETEKEKVFLARATEVTEEDKNKISIDKTSSVIIETDTENTFERDQMEHKEELQKQKESKTEKTKTFEEEQNKIMKEDKLLMEMVSTESTSAVEQTTIRKDQSEKTESRVKFEPKLDLNLEKSEIELSEKRFTKTAIKEEQISQKDDFRKTLLIDPSQVDQTMVEQTLAEVKESLDAVQEELIEVVKDGKLIKESPSEFEFKILPHVRYTTNDPIQESFQEEALSIDKYSKSEITDDKTEKTEATDTSRTDDYPSLSSIEDTSSKLEVVHRIKKDAKIDLTKRWSVPEPEESSSGDSHYRSFEKTDSRPLSSDVENLITLGGSSEYQTAQDASLFPESTEYVSAVSTLDHSGKTISSHESMKSFDSESSANLGSIEISEMSETLVPSTADADIVAEIQEEEFEFGVLMEDYQTSEVPSQMKRSHEMTFKQEVVGQTQATESPDVTEDKDDSDIVRKLSTSLEESRIIDESKFATSLEEGSVLSMSLSSTSYVDTVVENVEDLASSLGASSLAGADIQTLIRDDYISSSFDEHSKPEKVGGIFITSSMDKDDDINNETTTNIVSTTEIMDSEPKRSKGHKRTESTSFSSSDFLKEIETTKSKSGYESPLEEELIDVKPKHNEEKKESESESDYDAYESEYSRAYKTPTTQKKSKKKHSEVFEKDQEPEKRPFTPSQLISETIIEDATEEIESLKIEEERRPSQNMQDYSNIPDITITEDQQKYVVEEPEDEEVQDFEEKVLYKVKTQEELHKTDDTPIYYAKEQEYTVPEDRYQELIQQQYDANVADITKYGTAQEEEKADSPDSFEMLEQPDISDEFVIIEEVAKEADEFDTEGKSINIKNVKYVKRHDEEVEQILVKSAPADPNQGSAMYMRDDINFDFEESPPMASDQEGAETSDAAIANKKWVEMQLSDNASHLRYPYEMERGVLEDIKEEDTEFEVGSSRISSFKDSFSSTPEYDVLAGRKYFTREHDDVSMSSLQEFESLEQAISLENRKAHQGSQDSLSNGSFTKRYKAARHGQGDDISLSSLKEFEGLENACIEAHLIEIRAKEEAALLLSRSDESNKSSSGDEKVTAKPSLSATTTVVTTVKTTSTPSQILETKTTVMTQREIEALIKAKLEECEEESSNLMEVSTDSLELGLKKSKSINGSDKKGSGHGSCDSLEINKSNDNMTSSIDSFEISKDATGRSSRSEVDSLEQQLQLETRRDSVDSIELEQVLQMTKAELELPNDPKDQKTTTTTTTRIMQAQGPSSNTVVTKTVTVTSTTTAPSTQQQLIQKPNEEMTKDISSDSLNLHQMDPEQLLTSTESLDLHTSSTATNATYQNENDSLMSSSMTSCGSSTMIETLDSNFAEMFNYGTVTSSRTSPFLMHDEKFLQQQQPFQIATNVTETSSTTSTIRTQSKDDDGDKRTFEYFETYEKGSDKTDTFKSKTGEEATAEPKPEEKKK